MKRKTVTLLVALALALAFPAVAAETEIAGRARVIDGDTLRIGARTIRLHGIDAPESRQLCFIDGKRWQCGKDAANILADKIGRRPVTCEDLGQDRYKRIVARCTVAGENINAWMVSQGLALAYRRYSLDYVDEEAAAKAAPRGIWAGEFVKRWEWRRGKRIQASTDPRPVNCRIKGNISRRGVRGAFRAAVQLTPFSLCLVRFLS